MKSLFSLLILMITFSLCNAQCDEGEVEVTITVYTDNWGYETYWELLPSGNLCGDTPVFVGGNAEVGCDGAGDQDAPAGGYGNNSVFTEGPFCLTLDENYDIVFIDDWGDGGLTFEVEQNGILTSYFVGSGQGNTFTFLAGDETPAFIDGDRTCEALTIEVDGESLLVDNAEATVFPGEPSPPLLGCGVYGAWCDSNGGPSNTMWISFVAPNDGQIEISTCNEGTAFDTAVALYEVDDCNDFGTYNLISSNDDAYGGCGAGNGFAGVCYASCLTPGEEYFVMLEGWAGATGIAELTVTSTEVEEELDGFITNVACANIKGETGSRIIPQLTGNGVNYDIFWTGPFGFESEEWIINDVPAGDYTCQISNSCGLNISEVFTINQPEPVSTDFTVENTSCFGAGNGMLEVTASGGADPYQYSWTGPDEFFGFESQLDSLVEGSYVLEITDDNGCIYTSSTSVDTQEYLEFSLGEDETVCWNQFLLFEAPSGFYTFNWQDGSDESNYIFNAFSNGEGNHDISLTIENEEGCSYTDVVTITVEACTRVEEVDLEFEVYPNPASKILTIDFNNTLIETNELYVSLVNGIGQVTLDQNLNSSLTQLDVSSLSKGIYVLQIFQESKFLYSEKIIID